MPDSSMERSTPLPPAAPHQEETSSFGMDDVVLGHVADTGIGAEPGTANDAVVPNLPGGRRLQSARISSNVVLHAPLPPAMATNSPGSTDSDRS